MTVGSSATGSRSSLAPLLVLSLGAGMPESGYADAAELQRWIDEAPPYSVVTADRSSQIEIGSTIRIRKPLTLVGLNARLEPGLGKTPMLEVVSEGVRIRDFVLEGNRDTVGQDRRQRGVTEMQAWN